MRFLHLVVMVALVIAASHVYRIKFESTVQAERVAKLRAEIRREHDNIAALRADWAQLDSPARIQALAQRHLAIRTVDSGQIDTFDHLPMRPPETGQATTDDSIAGLIDGVDYDFATGSITGHAGAKTVEIVPVETRPVDADPGWPR